MRSTVVALPFFLLFVIALPSCKKKKDNPDYAAEADCSGIADSSNRYTNSIKALVDLKCATSGCHDATSAEQGIDMSTYAGTKSAFQNHNGLCAVHHGNDCQPMPQNGAQLSDAELKKLDCWVQNGYMQ